MVTPVFLIVVLVAGDWTPDCMEPRVAARLSRLDHLIMWVDSTMYVCDGDISPLVSAAWRHPNQYPFQLTIVRPDYRFEFLRNEPELGYIPVTSAVVDRIYTSRRACSTKAAWRIYEVVPEAGVGGTLLFCPLAQVFDLHLQDSTIPQLNLLEVFRRFAVTLVERHTDSATYRADVPMNGFTSRYEFQLNARGTPLRVRTELLYDDPGLRSAVWEQHTLATTEVNGAELIIEAIVTIQNPNVGTHYGVHHFIVTEYAQDSSLTKDSIRLPVERRNAAVSDYLPDGSRVKRYYDAGGNLIREIALVGFPEPLDTLPASSAGPDKAPAQSRAWLPLLGSGAAAGAVLLVLACRGHSRT